ncbi:glycosyltransferase [Cupriavidus gilardii]|uniref:glycosyltransferase n=1 Tax=Cupriavidus gilardii TaxID=82541 RepID=UPI00157388FC|nr:glycosyltransferase [Cupriavidus gilardii]NSX04484.1 glycosyltransferase [Cupriavidus gilardii]
MTKKNVELTAAGSALIADSAKIIADGGALIVVGERAEIRDHAVLEAVGGGMIEVGDRSIVGYNSWIHGSGGVRIGRDVMIGPSVAVTSSSHRYDLNTPMYQQGLRFAPVVVEDDVWIGANATIAAGSHIGRGAIISAGALVKGQVPPYTIAAGNPARVVSRRDVRTVLFYTLPLVIRENPLLFNCIFDRYIELAKSYEALGWRCVFAGTDELAQALRERADWRSPARLEVDYPQGSDWMSAWKAILLGQPLPFHQAYLERLLEDVKPDIVYCWNYDGLLRDVCNSRAITLSFNELGLSRLPNPVVYYSDPVGVNSTASMSAFWARYCEKERLGAIKVDRCLRAEQIRPNYLVGPARKKKLCNRFAPRTGNYVLVLLQVSDDSNIVAGGTFPSMNAYVDYCVAELGNVIDIVVKPHPAEPYVPEGPREGVTIAGQDDNTCELIGAAEAIVTINSSAGFEAAMAGKTVYVLGNAPYAGLGITIDVAGSLRDEWARNQDRAPADPDLLDRVADFAYHHYFLQEPAFFDAGAHLSRFAEWNGEAEALGPAKPYLKELEIDRYLAQIRDLRGKCQQYEEWIAALQKTAEDVERVSTWATQLKGDLESSQAERDQLLQTLTTANAESESLRARVAELSEALERSRAEFERTLTTANAEGESLRVRVAELSDALERSRAEFGRTLTTANAEAELLRAHVAELSDALERSRAELDQAQQALSASNANGESLRARIQELAEPIAVDSQQSIAALNEEIGRLKTKIDEIYRSRSWRASAPLRALARMARHPSTARLRLAHAAVRRRGGYVQVSRLAYKYYQRHGLDGIVRRLRLHFDGQVANIAAASAVIQTVEATQCPDPSELLPALSPPRNADVLVFGVIDWHFRFQRPQQLSLGFAKRGHRVFYISSELIPADRPGFLVSPIEGYDGVFQIKFHLVGLPNIYSSPAPERQRRQLLAGLAMLVEWTQASEYLSIVHHPFWLPLARALPRNSLVYDCMDHHEGFGHSAPEMISAERALMSEADALVVTSGWLYDVAHQRNVNTTIVRNACEFDHFANTPAQRFQDKHGRRVIGYYGAIAEWFDLDLLGKVAEAFPDCLILLVGADTCGAQQALKAYRNVEFVGEVPYRELPFYLYGFDICLLPFRVIDLTLATNPVKVYEYLCSGKPVVSVDLPELRQFGDLVYTADNADGFVSQCRAALAFDNDAPLRQRRIEFARQQTWEHRARELEEALAGSVRPLVSIVVVTYNNLDLTRKCLDSIERHTTGVRYEVVIVDNASQDGTPEFLRDYAASRPFVRLQLNSDNLGFSAANNQGLAMGKGDYLVILNNDTVVTSGWATGFIRHLRRDPTIGLIGPVTNNIGNEARIETTYQSLEEMPAEAARYTVGHMGESFDIHTLAFFCVMMPRTVYERIGGLDEAFGLGFFEDDDYCRRVQEIGMKCVCAEDVFVHHNLSASFNKLGEERKRKLMEKNKQIYEAKWGAWVPHQYRR